MQQRAEKIFSWAPGPGHRAQGWNILFRGTPHSDLGSALGSDASSRHKFCAIKGSEGGIYTALFPIFRFLFFCAKPIFLVRFLRIHPVQSVVNSPTQLSGRGFPCIFYMKLCVSQLYVFFVLQNGSRAVKT